jgi:hypothetical protein
MLMEMTCIGANRKMGILTRQEDVERIGQGSSGCICEVVRAAPGQWGRGALRSRRK